MISTPSATTPNLPPAMGTVPTPNPGPTNAATLQSPAVPSAKPPAAENRETDTVQLSSRTQPPGNRPINPAIANATASGRNAQSPNDKTAGNKVDLIA